MAETHSNTDQLAALAELDRLLTEHRLPYWLFGGWAVDFHVGRGTREHADIDGAVWIDDRIRLAELLSDAGWTHQPEIGEDGYTCYGRRGVRLEVAFLARDAEGRIYTPLDAGRGEWPHESFGNAVAQLNGVQASLVSRESLLVDKSVARPGAETAAKDRADVVALFSNALVGTPDPEIVMLEHRLREAQLSADVAALDVLLAEDLLFAGPDGRLATKSDDLKAHASGAVRFREHVPEELRVRRVGSDVAVTSLRARLTVDVMGARSHGTYRYTRVWAREPGVGWRVVGGQVSPVV